MTYELLDADVWNKILLNDETRMEIDSYKGEVSLHESEMTKVTQRKQWNLWVRV